VTKAVSASARSHAGANGASPGASAQPPDVSAPWSLAGTHRPEGSHTFGATQSFTVAHAFLHAVPSHLNGVQSIGGEVPLFTV
jgi:hypothetical protein